MSSPIQIRPEYREILRNIDQGEAVRHPLPDGGVLSVERGLPYLIVHRGSGSVSDDGTSRLVSGEASYLLAGCGEEQEISDLVSLIAESGSTRYGAFLVLEVWAGAADGATFVVRGPPEGPAPETVGRLVEGLRGLDDVVPGVRVEVETGDDRHPSGLPPLLEIRESWETGILLLGVEVPPVYQDTESGRVYPRYLRRLQRRLSEVLRKALYEFVRVQTTCKIENHLALGTRSVPDAVWRIDRELSAIERSYELLLLTSPVNEAQAWSEFRESGYAREPEFHYRLLPVDPDLLKRRLFGLRMEEIDDPALASLFQEKRQELDRQLGMLDERGSPAFRYSSMRLFGTVDEDLLRVAEGLLDEVPPPGPPAANGRAPEWVDARGFKAAAMREFDLYAEQHPAILERTIEIRPDLGGLMVSEGNLMIGEDLRLRPQRVRALLHHEVGTHVLTYVNGSTQPLEQLSLGLADYDELQEGLAVLAEYLVGGLNGFRMRMLAARVVAAHGCEQGADFVETFRRLTGEHGFPRRTAWNVTTRVYQSGGFTRDLIYLRGLIRLIEYLHRGGPLEPLYVGKIAQRHLPIMEELRHRSVLRTPPLVPRFLQDTEARRRLETVRDGITLTDLICPESE